MCVYRCLLLTKFPLQTSPSHCLCLERSPLFPVTAQRRTGSTHLSRCSGTPCCAKGQSKLFNFVMSCHHTRVHRCCVTSSDDLEFQPLAITLLEESTLSDYITCLSMCVYLLILYIFKLAVKCLVCLQLRLQRSHSGSKESQYVICVAGGAGVTMTLLLTT